MESRFIEFQGLCSYYDQKLVSSLLLSFHIYKTRRLYKFTSRLYVSKINSVDLETLKILFGYLVKHQDMYFLQAEQMHTGLGEIAVTQTDFIAAFMGLSV